MILLLIPLAAFFSAVCVALAVLARSMKEGQYYMTPLYLVCLPLIFLTLMPGIELNLFYSLVPDHGGRSPAPGADPGRLRRGLRGSFCRCWSRPSSTLGRPAVGHRPVSARGRPVPRGRAVQPANLAPAPAPRRAADAHRRQATLCFALILRLSWFLMEYMAIRGLGQPGGRGRRADSFILFPPPDHGGAADLLAQPHLRLLLAAEPLISSPALPAPWRSTRWSTSCGRSSSGFPDLLIIKESLSQSDVEAPQPVDQPWCVFALVPAVCEEFAFRGFILSGLEHHRHRTRSAILLSALMFGFLHVLLSLFQQLFNATLLGIVLGSWRSGAGASLPWILFHFLNNALVVTRGTALSPLQSAGLASWLYRDPAGWSISWVLDRGESGHLSALLLLYLCGRSIAAEAPPLSRDRDQSRAESRRRSRRLPGLPSSLSQESIR